MVLSMVSATLRIFKSSSVSADTTGISTDMDETESAVEYRSYLIVGTAYAFHDEDEPTKGRILVYSCNQDDGNDTSSSTRAIRTVAELQVRGGVYSMCQFYDGKLLVTVNSKTQVCQMVDGGTGIVRLSMVGVGHHGHILSLFVKSRACKMLGEAADSTVPLPGSEEQKPKAEEEKLAIVGDLMRSISLVQYYSQHETLEEVARDFNANWTTAVEMLTDDLYLGGENWNNLFVLRRNTKAQSEEIRCRLDTVGEFHLGEMCNKFMRGSLVMPHSTSSASNAGVGRSGLRRALASPTKKSATDAANVAASPVGASAALRSRRPAVIVGSQTLFGTVDGTLGAILGLNGPTSAFFATLERSMERVITPVGNFSHQQFRAFNAEQRVHPSHGFVDGDLVESFLDLDRSTMELVVQQMNRDGGWEIDDSAFTAAGANEKDAATATSMEDDERPELAVEDVLAVVEEMIMLH
jgi:DNA damage-binding protein 1